MNVNVSAQRKPGADGDSNLLFMSTYLETAITCWFAGYT